MNRQSPTSRWFGLLLSAMLLLLLSPVARGASYYVNDSSTANDAWCSAVGSDANNGTAPGTPKATFQSVVNTYDLEPGDSVYVDTGRYLQSTNFEIGSNDCGSSAGYVSVIGSPNGTTIDRGNTNNGAYGLYLCNADFVRVANLNITSGCYGVYLDGDHCVLSNLTVRNARDAGIRIAFVQSNRLERVTVRDCGADGIYLLATSNHVFRNVEVRGCADQGVYGDHAQYNTFENCLIWSNANMGVCFIWDSLSNRVLSSTVAFNALRQIYASGGGSSLELANSIVRASGTSNYCVMIYRDYKGMGAARYIADYNCFCAENGAFAGGYGAFDISGYSNYGTLAEWQTFTSQEAHSLSGDPLFVDRGGDFHLRSSAPGGTYVKALAGWMSFPGEHSPCIDAGDPAGPYAAEPVPNGARLNVGAYGNTPEASRSFGGPGQAYFVNDSSAANDVWCSALGDDANSGTTPADPKATVKAVLEAYDLEPGDTVYIDTGWYPINTNIQITAADAGSAAGPVTFRGSPNGSWIDRMTQSYQLFTNGSCVVMSNADYVSLSDLCFTNGYAASLYLYRADHCVLSNVTVRNTTDYGIHVLYGVSNLFTRVNVSGCWMTGLRLGFCGYNTIEHSLIWTNRNTGLDCSDGTNNRVLNSTFAFNVSRYFGQVFVSGGSLDMRNCILAASGQDRPCIRIDAAGYTGDYNDFYATDSAKVGYYEDSLADLQAAHPGQETHSFSQDPLFADPVYGDHHLKSRGGRYLAPGSWTTDAVHSPCIDSGDPASAWAGEPAPNGGRVNMGCWGNTEQASKATTDPWLLAASANDGFPVAGTFNLTWMWGNIAASNRVRLDVTTDGGITWHAIASGQPVANGAYAWDTTTEPGVPWASWRVVLESNPSINDAADRLFPIRNTALSYYVNDGSTAGDAWCSAAGDDANRGSANAPKASVQDVLADYDLEPGDTIHVDTGYYLLTNDITVGEWDAGVTGNWVTICGSPNGTTLDRGATNLNVSAVKMDDTDGIRLSDLTITNGYQGVLIQYCWNCELTNVTIRGAGQRYAVNVYVSGRTRLDGLDISGAKDGVSIYGSDSCRIEHCLIYNNQGDGVHVTWSSSDTRILNCTIAFNGWRQIDMADWETEVIVRNCILVASGAGTACISHFYTSIYGGQHGGVDFWYTGAGTYKGDYNNFYAMNGADVGVYTYVSYPTLADWKALDKQDTNGISADPLFVDAAAGDLHLRSSAASGTYVKATGQWTRFPGELSPSIDAGDPALSYASEPLPNGGRLNQGAYGNTPQASRAGDPARTFYVNDSSLANDTWCSAAGSDANSGDSPSSPKATIRAVLDAYDLEPRDTIYVDTGFYYPATSNVFGASDSGSPLSPVTIQGSPAGTVLAATNGTCLEIRSGRHIRVADLTITGAYYGVVVSNALDCSFSNVCVRDTRYEGLRIFYSTNQELAEVDLGRCGWYGALIESTRSLNLVRSKIWENFGGIYGFGMAIRRSTNVTLESCVVAYNRIAVENTGWRLYNSILSWASVDNYGLCDYRGDYNNWHNSTEWSFAGGTARWLPRADGQDGHSLAHDPLFADGTNGDFRLRSVTGRRLPGGGWTTDAVHSACIDAGSPAGSFDAEPAPNGGRRNIGCYGGTPDASKSRTNAWVLAVSLNGGALVHGRVDLAWACGNLPAPANLRIDYSSNSGATWVAVASNLSAATGFYSWDSTLQLDSPRAFWRVVSQSDPGVSDAVDQYFELRNSPLRFYVNNGSTANDAWCTVAGNDTNSGCQPSQPKASVQAVVDEYDLEDGDTVYIDTGHYLLVSNIVVSYGDGGSAAPVVFRGSPNGVTIDRGTNGAGTYCFGCVADWINVENLTLTNGLDGLFVDGSSCSFSNIVVRNAKRYGVVVSAYNSRFDRVDVRGCQDGVSSTSGDMSEFCHCVVAWNSGDGLHLSQLSEGYVHHGSVRNCTVAYNGYKQIDMTGYYILDLRDSIVVASGSGNACIYQYWQSWQGGHGSVWGGDGDYSGDYNCLYAENGATIAGGHTYQGSNEVYAWTGSDPHSISAEPKFVDGSDFHLRSSAVSGTCVQATGQWTQFPGENSPCIDAGDPSSPFAAEPAWNGGIVNAGAYGNTPWASRSVDSDGDLLSDTFETHRFGSNPNERDSDHDGEDDRHEFRTGMDPNDGDSIFTVHHGRRPQGPADEVVVEWPSVDGKTYWLESATSLAGGFSPVASGIAATPPMNSYTSSVSGVGQKYFRVGVEE